MNHPSPVTRGEIVAMQLPGHRVHLASVARTNKGRATACRLANGEVVESATANVLTIKAVAYQEAAKRLFPAGETWANAADLRAAIVAAAAAANTVTA